MERARLGRIGAAAAIVAAAFLMLGLFVYADRSGQREARAPLTEQTMP